LTTRRDRILATLLRRFDPSELEVLDESAAHAGHAGASPSGETHFAVIIRSDYLDALSRVERHRAINAALAEEFASGLHALSIRTA
jgi:BolA family transcriptional regulator, general stress-responsive regulator